MKTWAVALVSMVAVACSGSGPAGGRGSGGGGAAGSRTASGSAGADGGGVDGGGGAGMAVGTDGPGDGGGDREAGSSTSEGDTAADGPADARADGVAEAGAGAEAGPDVATDTGVACSAGTTRSCAADGLVGPCASGTETCVNGTWGPCSRPPRADTCDAQNDDSCNGIPNEGCICINGATGTCAEKLGSKGSCATGTSTCVAGKWGACSHPPASADTCDLDNDDNCNGTPDEGCLCINGATGSCGLKMGLKGTCSGGTATCSGGSWSCDRTPKGSDTCDSGNDDSCDGTPNGGCVCINGATGTCGLELGLKGTCAAGITTCAAGKWGTCGTAPAAFDMCAIGNDDMCTGVAIADVVSQRAGVMPNPPGAGLPNPASYTANADGTVTDNVTMLTWQGMDAGAYYAQADGAAYCATLGPGWRLPTRVELVSILDYTGDYSPGESPPLLNGVFGVVHYTGSYGTFTFWTSSSNPSGAWVVDFLQGDTNVADPTTGNRVRCVR